MEARHELQEKLRELVAKHGWNEVDLELRLLAAKKEKPIVMTANGEVEWVDNWIRISRTEV